MKMRTGFHALSVLGAVAGAAMLAMSVTTLAEDTGTGYWTYGGPFAMWANGVPTMMSTCDASTRKPWK